MQKKTSEPRTAAKVAAVEKMSLDELAVLASRMMSEILIKKARIQNHPTALRQRLRQ